MSQIITLDKLESRDYFRAQVNLPQKLVWAVFYNSIANMNRMNQFPKTESHGLRQFPAVVVGCDSPKGLGTAGNEPLMQNLRADHVIDRHRDRVTAGNTFHATQNPLTPPDFPVQRADWNNTPMRELASRSVCGREALLFESGGVEGNARTRRDGTGRVNPAQGNLVREQRQAKARHSGCTDSSRYQSRPALILSPAPESKCTDRNYHSPPGFVGVRMDAGAGGLIYEHH